MGVDCWGTALSTGGEPDTSAAAAAGMVIARWDNRGGLLRRAPEPCLRGNGGVLAGLAVSAGDGLVGGVLVWRDSGGVPGLLPVLVTRGRGRARGEYPEPLGEADPRGDNFGDPTGGEGIARGGNCLPCFRLPLISEESVSGQAPVSNLSSLVLLILLFCVDKFSLMSAGQGEEQNSSGMGSSGHGELLDGLGTPDLAQGESSESPEAHGGASGLGDMPTGGVPWGEALVIGGVQCGDGLLTAGMGGEGFTGGVECGDGLARITGGVAGLLAWESG